MHLGMVSVIGRSRLPTPAASRKAFTRPPLLTAHHAQRAHLRVGLGQHPVQAVHALEPFGVGSDRVGRGVLRLPAQRPQRADVGQDVPGVAEPVLAGHRGRQVGAVLAPHDLGELPGGDRLAAADVEHPAHRALVRQHQHVGVHHVVDVDVVADVAAVLVQRRRLAEQVAQAEDAAGAGVGVVDRLPRALDDAVPQRDGRDAVPAAEVDRDHLLAELGHAVGVLRVGDPLRRGLHLQRAAADRAGDVPLARGQRALRAHARQLLAVGRAAVQPLAHGRLRRGHHHPGEVQPLGDDDLVEQRGGDHVDVGEPGEVGQVVLVGGEVVDRVHPAQQVGEQLAVADVALEEVGPGDRGWRACRPGGPAGSARRGPRPHGRGPAAGRRCASR